MEQISAVRRAFDVVLGELGPHFTLDMLIREITYLRGKPLICESWDFPPGITGCCMALQDVDLILTRKRLEFTRLLPVTLHECAHFLLRHIPLVSNGLEDVTYLDFIEQRDLQFALLRDRTSAYDAPHEHAAESLATLLWQQIIHSQDEQVLGTFIDLWER